MEVSISDITEIEKEISIQMTAAELLPYFEKAYQRQLPEIEIKGFRKGKAPLDMVKKMHGEAIEYKSLDSIASEAYKQVITERDIHPIGDPILTDMDYKRGENFSFKIKYEIKPVVTVDNYKGLAVEKVVHKINDSDVENELLRLRHANSTLAEVEAVTDDEHIVTADIQQLDESGAPLIGKKNPDVRLYIAGGTMYKEIKEALRNAAVGANQRVRFDVEHEGQKQTNHVDLQVKKIEKVVLPELSDDFIKKVTKEKMTSVEEFTTHLRKDMEEYANEQDDHGVVDSLVAEIVKRHEFPVPESLVHGILDSMIEEMKNRSQNKKLPPDFDDAGFREQNRPYALFQAKWYLIRERIIEKEGIKVEDADLESIVDIEAPKIGIEKERLLAFYKSSEGARDKILNNKLITFLKEQSNITEKIAEEVPQELN